MPDVALTLRNLATDQIIATTMSGAEGEYAFRNLSPAKYEIRATKPGFQRVLHADVEVTLSSVRRVDITLPIGVQDQRIEVVGGSSLLGTSATHEHGITPETLLDLPLAMSLGPRAAAAFATLMPGVATGGAANPYDVRINGGLQAGDEATLDGVSMQQGFMSQSGMVSIFVDFPMSPDMVSEVKVFTSNYAPEFGASTSGQIMAVTRSGGSAFHGAVFEYHRDDSMMARQWGSSNKPTFRRDNFGANIGGPARLPGLWNDRWKSYFFFNFEGYRQTGASNRPTISIPSMQERNGDFRDWRDADGNLIPIFDPLTLRPDGHGGFIKDQFMGCDGNTPNVICPSRINPIVSPWLRALPAPSTDGPLNNYQPAHAVPETGLPNSDYYMGRYDLQLANSDHFFVSLWHQRSPAQFWSLLPKPIANEAFTDPQNSWVSRFNYDKSIRPTLLNHLSMGYLNRNEGYGCVNQDYVDDFPRIAGVASHKVPPYISFNGTGFNGFGCPGGQSYENITTRPTFIVNDIVTWIRSGHTVKAGMEYRKIMGNLHDASNEAGSFDFQPGATGLVDLNSGSPIASFLLGAVDNANATFRAVNSSYPRQHAVVVHAGDTWRINDRFTLDYGLRWDYYSPSSEKYDRFSFFDPNGPNSGAGERPGRLAFAGDAYGANSFGARYPEDDWYGGFAPRLGGVFALNDRTVVRAGWGIFYTQAFYPGWGGGISQDGFSNTPSFSSTLGGIEPAFYLEEGFPQAFARPPDIRDDYRNGQGILYRPLDANERPYSHQWNVTVDRELGRHLALSVAYVGTAGRRLPSSIDPINAIDLGHLAMGDALNREFGPGDTSVAGVPIPYPGWAEQMTACAPSVAQALRPFPQYCDNLQGLNENHGESMYNSLQLKLEKRFSDGIYALVSYTLSKTTGSALDSAQRDAWSGLQGVISPFEPKRNDAIAPTDTPHILSAAFVYELPFGRGKQYMNESGAVNAMIGGWQLSTIFRYSSALPMYFRSANFCNVPGAFRAACIPAIINPGAVFAQDPGSFDPANGPLFNRDAFEPVSVFNFYQGRGNRVEAVRGFAYKNQDLSLIKNTRLPGGMNVQVRVEAFNVWNWHSFTNPGRWGGLAFNNDIASPNFGTWNGSVSESRTIQIAGRFEF